jgi:hypothetical protein
LVELAKAVYLGKRKKKKKKKKKKGREQSGKTRIGKIQWRCSLRPQADRAISISSVKRPVGRHVERLRI